MSFPRPTPGAMVWLTAMIVVPVALATQVATYRSADGNLQVTYRDALLTQPVATGFQLKLRGGVVAVSESQRTRITAENVDLAGATVGKKTTLKSAFATGKPTLEREVGKVGEGVLTRIEGTEITFNSGATYDTAKVKGPVRLRSINQKAKTDATFTGASADVQFFPGKKGNELTLKQATLSGGVRFVALQANSDGKGRVQGSANQLEVLPDRDGYRVTLRGKVNLQYSGKGLGAFTGLDLATLWLDNNQEITRASTQTGGKP